MIKSGLVSVSFRGLSPEEILTECSKLGIGYIEWGSDVHAPCDNEERLKEICRLQKSMGISCCSYGTYFRAGKDSAEDLRKYIAAAKLLETDTLRIWCGTKNSCEYTPEEAERLVIECRALAKIAEREGVTLATEFHMGTYTDSAETTSYLVSSIGSSAFKTYWQPNQYKSLECNAAGSRAVAGITENIHVFNWEGNNHLPLEGAIDTWKTYLSAFSGEHYALLEFMPDGRIESLPAEWESLKRILGDVHE